MSSTALILLFFIMANLPWISERVFLIYSLKMSKKIIIRLAETLVFYIFSLLLAIFLEVKFSGEVYSQGWEFFTITFCLFVVMSVPSIIFHYQWLPMHKK